MSNWREISDQIRSKIESGTYAYGAKLPKETDLAESFAVSRSTIHRALEHLEHEGYLQSRKRAGTFVHRTRQERKHMIALIFDRVAKNFDFPASEMIEGIKQTLGDHCGLVLCDSKDSISREANFITRMSKETDGIICFPIADQRDGNLLQQIHNAGAAVVVIDRIPRGYEGSSIVSNDSEATKQAIRMLKAKGHKSIGFIGFLKETVSSAMARHAAFVEGVEECFGGDGNENVRWLGKDLEMNGIVLEQSVYDVLFSLTQGPEKITALYCLQDDLALKVQNAAERIGLNIPNQLEVVCVNEWPALELRRPWDIHRIVRRKYEIGVQAARLLNAQIENPTVIPEHLSIPADLIPSSPDNLPMLEGVHAWLQDEKKSKEIIQ
jgi:GntR family transcriptional regulator, arabinose operon transcriptional repressor